VSYAQLYAQNLVDMRCKEVKKKENFSLRLHALPMNANAFCQLFFGSSKLETIIREHRHIVEQKNLMSAISLLLNHAGKIYAGVGLHHL